VIFALRQRRAPAHPSAVDFWWGNTMPGDQKSPGNGFLLKYKMLLSVP